MRAKKEEMYKLPIVIEGSTKVFNPPFLMQTSQNVLIQKEEDMKVEDVDEEEEEKDDDNKIEEIIED